jgi:hypothetical protein
MAFVSIAFSAIEFESVGARAQQAAPFSSLSGQVEDSTGAAVAGAEVTLTDSGSTVLATVVTDKEGHFVIKSVPPGSYVLTAQGSGFQPSRTKVSVSLGGAPITLKVLLKVGAVSQTVTVVGEDSYAVSVASAGTKIDMPLMETPMAVHRAADHRRPTDHQPRRRSHQRQRRGADQRRVRDIGQLLHSRI